MKLAWKFVILPIIIMFIIIFFITKFGNYVLAFVNALDLPFFSFVSALLLSGITSSSGPQAVTEDFLIEIPKTLCFLAFFYFINLLWDLTFGATMGKHAMPWKNPFDKSNSSSDPTDANKPKSFIVYFFGSMASVMLSSWITSRILKWFNAMYSRVIACIIVSVIAVIVMIVITKYQMGQRGLTRASLIDVLLDISVNIILKSAILIFLSYLILTLIYLGFVYSAVLYIFALPLMILIALIGSSGAALGIFKEKGKHSK